MTAVAAELKSAIESEVEVAKKRYAAHNPRSAALYAKAKEHMPGGNTRTALHFEPFPLYVERSEGARIRSVDGQEYLDLLGEFTAGLYGHRNPTITAAILKAAEAGASNGAPGENEIKLAELICDRFPSIERVRFCNSGTEANLFALTLARIVTGRSKFIVIDGGYHGGVLSFQGAGTIMNVPMDFRLIRYNDCESAERAIAEAGSELAAVIVEPMMSNGGSIPASREFLETLRRCTREQGALLIFDEIVTSRMGRGGLQQYHGITPDLTTLGKYLGGGFSFGAFGGSAALMERFDPSRAGALVHSGTFNNNVFTTAAGVAGLRDVFTRERSERLFQDGETLRRRLQSLTAQCAGVTLTGIGSVMKIHFGSKGTITCPQDVPAVSKEIVELFFFDLLEQGIYPARRGQMTLSLPMTFTDFDIIADAVERFVADRRELLEASVRS
ncbi:MULTISPECIES: aminotransferase class III-fold pyridoxal phosphate-dependent enzyme [unclassified Caballeronia]|jgi:glutamate-1-semialdehyde 2,1-aminomutase|uniref:aspartate aminotransferase family protein n=1 Tax=unclassified Caballeronia TaxID=2646786 RepID=UPI002027FEBD|nr:MULTISPECIES: aminotransferase class III-fold pyridoxal phosphate-dependent enzyme [unclassified Caballeronia]